MRTSILFTALTLLSTTFSLPTPTSSGTTLLQVRDDTISKADVFSIVEERQQSCYETCGSVCYYQTTINNAVQDGYSRYRNGNTQGGYPHTYNNYEGFSFPVSGPYQEYPVLSSFKAYSGASPGADRVIFNTKGQYAGAITHTGASGNNFVACD